MDTLKKLAILSAAAKYDVSCSSSGSDRGKRKGMVGNATLSGICHSWSEDGRCISLLKILMTNVCSYDCAFCVNRRSNDVPRATFTPEEIAELTIGFYRRNYIEGLFLSSAVHTSPDYTMEKLLATVRQLRQVHRYNGYIHLKAIPGADERLIQAAGQFVDRMSVNIELPSAESLQLLAPQKQREHILQPMAQINHGITANREERRTFRRAPRFVPAGQSTQLIVGATTEDDRRICQLAEGLYRRFQLKRVYYSAYVPVVDNPKLPALTAPPLKREHRLYQADWLLRFYGFGADELLDPAQPYLDLDVDPKTGWALRNLHFFPLEINQADYAQLLRVPGIGVQSARRIVAARRMGTIHFEHLQRIGVVLRRARYFITCQGRYYGQAAFDAMAIRRKLVGTSTPAAAGEQLSLF
ncbi:putative DNA modification/repair radical SAM protein [Heliophilum fasciatum]|uniref:Putative DNA modification/repair radical SAM protein n=1 Tax=Heliophilum fasciatum TaxID=35700 RepID=A0A4R2RKB5_9FIRM|nr:putative DNA modification/repair radical SAM protein [Heliophilum fasciatum]MCW2278048.1 putative DNA modification/repair radical SAM protein [Heliophilum fasciatum]TCP64332.1 putative DNA modification/repair radical SAM protein [Heliophilum fasciatum]